MLSKAYVCGRLMVETAGSNLAKGMDFLFFCLL
jgi:hypothetical protein